jgi:hypothetical protein
LYYDVYIGRWPVETSAETDTMIRKFFTYTKTPDTLYQKRILLPCSYLFPLYDYTQPQDSIANLSPAGWTDRVVDMGQNYTAWRLATRDSLNTGFGFTHLVGHGNYQGVYITTAGGSSGPMYYYTDPATQTNYDKLVIANSNACISGNFETNDCLAEEMVKARGSAIAAMMNSRYGWGYNGNYPPGPSELLDIRFYHFFFSRDSIRISHCHQASKENYRNTAYNDLCWRWCYYELNLFGEPQMMMWKDNPKKIIARFNNPAYTGSQNFAVICSSQGLPLSGASVCLWKGSEVYIKGTTNANGQVSLSINPATIGNMYVTVTTKNRIPCEDSTAVVYLSDVGVTAIEVPASVVDSTGPIMPRVRIENFGGQPATFSVKLTIGSYTNTRASKTIATGANDTVNFALWTPVRGTHTVKCSVYMSGDAVFVNDTMSRPLTVRVKNVGVVSLNSPTGVFDSFGPVMPVAFLKNHGTETETFDVKYRIGGLYNSTRSKTLSTGQQDTVGFPDWIPVRGTYQIKCSTALSSDVQYSNDTMSNLITVQVKDVGATEIVIPNGTIDSSPPIMPQLKVKNYGTNQAIFTVYLKIGTGYSQNRAKTLNAGIEDTVNFISWQPIRGTHLVQCSVALINDAVSNNDILIDSVTVSVKDIEIVAIECPAGSVDSGPAIIPRALVKNNSFTQETFNITFTVNNGYSDTRAKTINAGQQDTVNFTEWTGIRGTYTTRCSVHLTGDVEPGNDTISGAFTLNIHDVGVVSITVPNTDTIERANIAPRAYVRNYGTQQETFYAYCKIYNSVGTQLYYDSVLTSDLNPNSQSTQTFAGFNFQIGTYEIRCSTALANDGQILNDVSLKTVVVRYQQPWLAKESVPHGPSNKPVKSGGALVSGIGGNLYALKGNNTREFYKYDIDSDSWTLIDSIPFDTLKTKKVNKGAALAYNKHANPDIIYATKGNNTLEFWAYDVELNTWTQKTYVPIDPATKVKRVKGGASLVYLRRGSAQYIYLLKGNKTREFYAYHCQADTWIKNLEMPPLGPEFKLYRDGSCMTVGYNNYIYLLKGGAKTNEFYCYQPAEDTWLTLESIPIYSTLTGKKSKVKDGASICYDGDSLLYAFKGGNRQEFWCYNAIQNAWHELDTLPRGLRSKKIKSGSSLIFADDKIYALKGNKTYEFWTYTPGISDIPVAMVSTQTTLMPIQQELTRNDVEIKISVLPNPLTKNSVIRFNLPGRTMVRITLYNSAGQLVSAIINNEYEIGCYALPLNSTNLAAGIYHLRFDAGKQTETIKIIVR